MTVSSVSATSAAQPWQQVRNDYQTLSQALAQGDVTAAQKAYASIQQDQQNGPQPPASSPAAQDFTALGQALRNGDLDAAKQAFSSLQTDFQNLRQARRAGGGHHGGKGAGGGDDNGADASADKTIASQVTATNANGTLTVTITYTDGSTSSRIQPNPAPAVSQSLLAAGNSGQLAALLSAQEQRALLQPAAEN